jgi:hypothetical protein
MGGFARLGGRKGERDPGSGPIKPSFDDLVLWAASVAFKPANFPHHSALTHLASSARARRRKLAPSSSCIDRLGEPSSR